VTEAALGMFAVAISLRRSVRVSTYSSEADLIQTVASLQAEGLRNEVLHALRRDWPVDRLIAMLVTEDLSLLEAVLFTLGFSGVMGHSKYLAAMLRHPQPPIVKAAEHALWQIWMRAGTTWGNDVLRQAIDRIEAGRLDQAEQMLAELTRIEPNFAEAHHQAGLVAAQMDRLDQAANRYQKTLRLNAHHFTAAEGLGFVFLEQGHFARSREYYSYAIQIHPGLESAHEMLAGLDRVLGASGASGQV
jgi:tetratricopeptide (TPR) repeat protein